MKVYSFIQVKFLFCLMLSCASNSNSRIVESKTKEEIEMIIYAEGYEDKNLVLDITNNSDKDTISLLSHLGYYCCESKQTKIALRWRTDISEISRFCSPQKIAPNENARLYLKEQEPVDSAVYSIDYELNGNKTHRTIAWGK